jgi:RNHCP domain
MAPVGAFTRAKGEHAIVHRCLGCGFERYNRVAADDDFVAVMRLAVVQPRVKPARRSTDVERTA